MREVSCVIAYWLTNPENQNVMLHTYQIAAVSSILQQVC